jgi:hypothetical protein
MNSGNDDRAYWLGVLKRLGTPVLRAAGSGKLRATMPVEVRPGDPPSSRAPFAHLEAVARLLCGIAPWLELEEPSEATARDELRDLARRSLASIVDPDSPDKCNFLGRGPNGRQPLVDAAFIAQAILRAPSQLWTKLPEDARRNVLAALRSTRPILPYRGNWLLFSAMIEAMLCTIGEADWDPMRIDYALRQHDAWYKGDGIYGDGPSLHADYYNAFVIQPMLVDVIRTIADHWPEFAALREPIMTRARRFAVLQERCISPEGTFPPVGRSLAYRFGALQGLAQMALLHELAPDLPPAQVRCAMTAVIRRMTEAPGTFEENGWLTIGFCGHQPSVAENYISTGSCYLCSVGLLPLGLPPSDEFWSGAPIEWTSKQAWRGIDFKPDHAID